MKDFILNNFSLISMIVLAIVAIVLGQKRMAFWQWFNETAFIAFALAETHGILEGLKGADKLKHYLEIYKAEYEKKFGKAPGFEDIQQAEAKAAELALKEKEIKLSDPFAQQGT